MSILTELSSRIRRGEPIPVPLLLFLWCFTPVLWAGMLFRSFRKPVRLPVRVVSVGNITAGGTGKTPAVIDAARRAIASGEKVAVLTRGYRAKSRGAGVEVVDGSCDVMGLFESLGDEPALILRKLPAVTIVRAVDRVAGARAAVARGCTTLILDDGFQYLRLARDENLVMVDATNPFGNGYRLPAGILRERPEALRRATGIYLTRCDQCPDVAALAARVAALAPGIPIRQTWHAPCGLWNVATGEPRPLQALRGTAITAVCGLGNPEAFWRTLEAAGAILTRRVAYPDHAEFDAMQFRGVGMVVTSEKDAVRLGTRAPDNLWALSIELRDWPDGSPATNEKAP